MEEGCLISPAFTHVFSGGYAAGYYGYKWSELLDADAFAAFLENGIFDKKTAQKFKKMLQAGDTLATRWNFMWNSEASSPRPTHTPETRRYNS